MRHVVSLVLSVVLSPLVYVAAGYATVKLEAAPKSGTIHWNDVALGGSAALLAGVLYAVLVMARLSPVGPFLAGVGYGGITSWALFNASNFHSTFSASILGTDGVLVAPVGAGTFMLAVPLLITIFSPRRWRRSDPPVPATYNAAPVYATMAESAAPEYPEASTYKPPSYDPPLYTPANYSPTVPEQSSPTVPEQSSATAGEPTADEGRTTTTLTGVLDDSSQT
jgi:hypothetical protein